ncbi:MAG TPA: GMC family oxidoreductase [Bryobacteraceae bacterium]|jgi:gluconate 2-dehydrogenase alpha chain|nr:GMC family oxidoreductase [Bryobacteraceae bacterium]
MKTLKRVDVAIVGGGWTGLAMAKEITGRTSLSVLILERGHPRKTADYADGMDELDYAIRARLMQNIAEETITHRHSIKDPSVPVRQYGAFMPGSGVGGAGEHWNGHSFRFLETQFVLATHLREKFGAAHLPENLAVQDWGVTYNDLEPFYWRGEQMMGVSGKAGNIRGQKLPGGNVFEGPRMSEYPLPALKTAYAGLVFKEAVEELGYSPYPHPAANASEAYKNPDGISRAGCAYCGFCERFGCMIGAKAQPTNTLLPIVSKRKNFALRTGCWVRRVVHKDGHATGVQYVDANGEEVFQPADNVVLATFTLNNVKLLSLSKIGTPYDPLTAKGTLGKNLTHQVGGASTRVMFDKPLNAFMGSGAMGMMIADFDGDHALNGSESIVRGGTISVGTSGNRPIASFGSYPAGASKSNWGSEWKAASLEWRDRTSGVGFTGEHLAYRQNFMDLDPQYTDKMGDPLLRFTLDWTEHEHQQRLYATGVQVKIAKAMGLRYDNPRVTRAKYNVSQYQTTHIQGGAVMGTSPDTSVVDTHLRHWDVKNLWVIGASAFPQNASGNPTLTALALTYRAADAFIAPHSKKGAA